MVARGNQTRWLHLFHSAFSKTLVTLIQFDFTLGSSKFFFSVYVLLKFVQKELDI